MGDTTLHSYMVYNGDLVMILENESTGIWWYAISTEYWDNYFGQNGNFSVSDEMVCEFIADEENATVGTSCASFESVCLAYVDYFQN